MGDWPVVRKSREEAPPQFAAGLQHPWFEVHSISNIYDTTVSFVRKLAEAVQTDQFRGAFDEFLGKELPVGPASDNHELIVASRHPAEADNAGSKHGARNGLRSRKIVRHENMRSQHSVKALPRNAPHRGSRSFAELSELKPMRFFQHAQLLDDKYCLKRKGYRQTSEAFFFATLQSALPADPREQAAVLGKKRMVVKWMTPICRRLPPKARGRAEKEPGFRLPVLKQINERVLIVEWEELWIESIQFIAHQVMKGHARVLCGALNEPVQRKSLLNLKLLFVHALLRFRRRCRTRLGPMGLERIGLGFWLRWRDSGGLLSRLGPRRVRLSWRRERFSLGHEYLAEYCPFFSVGPATRCTVFRFPGCKH